MSTVASASVALFYTSGSVLVVSSLVKTLTFSLSYALVQFFIDGLSGKTVAAGHAFLYTDIWLNLPAGLTTDLTTFLVYSASSTLYGARSSRSPVSDDFTV